MAVLLKTASVWVSSIQIMQVRVQNKGKSVWKSRYGGDVSLVCPLLWPIKPISLPGVPGTPSGDPVSPGTLPVSKYHRPIYHYLPLGHLETPRHVRDLIRDSEQTSVIK